LRSFALPISLMFLLFCSSCLELVRRPTAKTAATYSPQTTANDSNTAFIAASSSADSAGAPMLATAFVHPKRSNQQRSTIKQVNEYALWCINNGMWNEAQSHMERAIGTDSLAASLHNNLGIVYERLGQTDKAAEYYQRAFVLNPDKKAYQANLKKLQTRQQTFQDTSNDFDIFRVPPTERRRRDEGDEDGETPTLIGE
jgi:Flp pilus assembly protein TadD